VTNTKSYPEV